MTHALWFHVINIFIIIPVPTLIPSVWSMVVRNLGRESERDGGGKKKELRKTGTGMTNRDSKRLWTSDAILHQWHSVKIRPDVLNPSHITECLYSQQGRHSKTRMYLLPWCTLSEWNPYPFFCTGGVELDIYIKQWETGSCFSKELFPPVSTISNRTTG